MDHNSDCHHYKEIEDNNITMITIQYILSQCYPNLYEMCMCSYTGALSHALPL